MFEDYRSFSDYVRDYDLQRSEGLLLRHLNSVFKVLAQTVPDGAKNDEVRDMELYLGAMIRQVDSSLLDEWEKMRDASYAPAEAAELRPPGSEAADLDITRDRKGFTAAIRNRLFTFLRSLVVGDWEEAAALLAEYGTPEEEGWTAERLKAELDLYRTDHQSPRLDAEARNIRHTYVLPEESGGTWRVQQMLVDPEDFNDWVLEVLVDLAASRAAGVPVLALQRLGSYR
jgi:hypothetical protein